MPACKQRQHASNWPSGRAACCLSLAISMRRGRGAGWACRPGSTRCGGAASVHFCLRGPLPTALACPLLSRCPHISTDWGPQQASKPWQPGEQAGEQAGGAAAPALRRVLPIHDGGACHILLQRPAASCSGGPRQARGDWKGVSCGIQSTGGCHRSLGGFGVRWGRAGSAATAWRRQRWRRRAPPAGRLRHRNPAERGSL